MASVYSRYQIESYSLSNSRTRLVRNHVGSQEDTEEEMSLENSGF